MISIFKHVGERRLAFFLKIKSYFFHVSWVNYTFEVSSVEVGLFQMTCNRYLKKRFRNLIFDNLHSLACHLIKPFFVSRNTWRVSIWLEHTAPSLWNVIKSWISTIFSSLFNIFKNRIDDKLMTLAPICQFITYRYEREFVRKV